MKRKLLAGLLTLCMAVGMAVPAFASYAKPGRCRNLLWRLPFFVRMVGRARFSCIEAGVFPKFGLFCVKMR